MTILVAPDKFRGSLTARQVCDAMTEGIRLATAAGPAPTTLPYPDVANPANVVALPLADGGEGTAEVLTAATGGQWHTFTVADPLGRPVTAGLGLSADGHTAFIEMAQASGLRLLRSDERDPLRTTTFGTGELIRHAWALGAQHVVLGIGGSATTDAGLGMAAALGWRFLDAHDRPVTPTGGNLTHIQRLEPPANVVGATSTTFPAPAPWPPLRVTVACDVANPLFGPDGAAYVYGPQKGASPDVVKQLDKGLRHVANVVKTQLGLDLAHQPGAGAAGGLGYGARVFLGATLQEGIELVLAQTRFSHYVAHADLVLTGEGKLDRQTLQGKVLAGVCARARQVGVPVVALCGTLDLPPADVAQLGLTAAFSVLTRPQTLAQATERAYDDVRAATFQVMRMFMLRHGSI